MEIYTEFILFVYTDIEGVFNGKKVEQQVECLELINLAIKISKKGTIYNLSITGHSLGVIFWIFIWIDLNWIIKIIYF